MRRECLLDGVVLALEKRGIDHLVAISCLKNWNFNNLLAVESQILISKKFLLTVNTPK